MCINILSASVGPIITTATWNTVVHIIESPTMKSMKSTGLNKLIVSSAWLKEIIS
jgi:hypothetical protein